MRTALLLLIGLLGACAPVATSQTIIARPLLDRTTLGGPGYPVVIAGEEALGLSEAQIASGLRFPASIGGDFHAVAPDAAPATHARLALARQGERGAGTLTFMHGERRIGVGIFSMPAAAFADPRALGAVSAGAIADMLAESQQLRQDDDEIWRLY